jgi:hypothetical protein
LPIPARRKACPDEKPFAIDLRGPEGRLLLQGFDDLALVEDSPRAAELDEFVCEQSVDLLG